jgi:hypothetical protein
MLKADNNGRITGKFTIPANVPAGRKEVRVLGEQGSLGGAMFVGDGTITDSVLQKLTTTIINRYDPLAQTFTLNSPEQVPGVDVFMTAIGTKPVRVQLRETGYGVPSQVVLGESIMQASAMTPNAMNRFMFAAPVALAPNVEYAIVVLTNDAVPAVGVAELGKYDSSSARWVTVQPFQVGVMLSSSNASTWTPHQDRDLTFRLLAMRYTETSRLIDLGTVAVANVSELQVAGIIDSPLPGAVGNYVLTLPDGTVYNAAPGQVISLGAKISGNVGIKAALNAVASHSAVLQPGSQLGAGAVAATADYVTPVMQADVTGTNIKLLIDGIVPSGASFTAWYSGADAGDAWVQLVADVAPVPLGNNLYEYSFKATGVTEAKLRFKLVLNGTPAARPRLRNLRISLT